VISDSDRDEWQVFQRCAPFAALPPALLREVFSHVETRDYAIGQALIRQGEAGDGLFVLLSGSARATLRDGAEHLLALFQRGDVIGEMALVTREPRTADVIADSPVQALYLPAAAFDRLAARHVVLGMVLTELVASRLGQASRDGLGGKLIEGYRIERCLGRGGMAIVYRAVETASGRDVALKMMSHRLIYEPGALVRFHQEADLMGTFRHENIAALERLFPAYNTHFLVMEFCDGGDFNTVLSARGPLPEPVVRRVLGQLATALDHIHQRGLIHRDLKPNNMLLTRAGLVKLSDFGLATVAASVNDETRVTAEGLMGTPAYMAPEQLSNAPLDARADIYAVGCVAYALLAAKPLFRSDNLYDLIQEKLARQVPAAHEIAGGISTELHDFIVRALRIDRAERPASLASLIPWAGRIDAEWVS
jgi:CRP-like cAMP-binding protein